MSINKTIQRWYNVGLDWEWFLGEVNNALKPGDKLLDAGAGECKWAEHFPEAEYIGLDYKVGDEEWDFSRVMIEADLNDKIPMDDNAVDVIISIQVLEHLNNPKQAMKEMARVLKPGGHLFMTTPFSYQEHQQPYDFYRYTRYGLQYLIDEAGLDADYIKPMGGYYLMLREKLQYFHDSRFFGHANPFLKLLLLPVKIISKLLNVLILPPILYHLDKLDDKQEFTLGHTIHAVKPIANN